MTATETCFWLLYGGGVCWCVCVCVFNADVHVLSQGPGCVRMGSGKDASSASSPFLSTGQQLEESSMKAAMAKMKEEGGLFESMRDEGQDEGSAPVLSIVRQIVKEDDDEILPVSLCVYTRGLVDSIIPIWEKGK